MASFEFSDTTGQCELGHEYHFVAKTYFSNVSLRVPTNDPASSLYR